MEKRTFKNKIYQELASIVKALSNPNRLEIVELLAQGYFSVEEIANQTDLSVANASQHLQVLKRVQLVDTRREGNYVFYSLADQSIYKAWIALRDVGMERVAEIEKTMRMFRESKSSMKTMSSSELAKRMENGDVTIIDVRPEREFNEGHIAGALNVPVEDLTGRLVELSDKKEVVAYCRGPFCVLADEAVELLHEKGYSAWRLNEGFPEWMLEHLPVSKNG